MLENWPLKLKVSQLIFGVHIFNSIHPKNDISKLNDLYMVLSIHSSINLIESIISYCVVQKAWTMYIYPRNFAYKKLKDIVWQKKFNKLVPLSESKLEFRPWFRTQNLCKDHLFHTDMYVCPESPQRWSKLWISGARWRPRTGDFTTNTVLSFEAS